MQGDIEAICRNHVIEVAEAYADATGLAMATISARFHGSQRFLTNLRDGESSITLSGLERLLNRFSAEWPKGAPFPKTPLPSGPNRSGCVYIVSWSRRPDRLRIGFSGHLLQRMDMLNCEAKKGGSKLVMIGSVTGRIRHERRVHQMLKPFACRKGESSWYHRKPEVEELVHRILSPGFHWTRDKDFRGNFP